LASQIRWYPFFFKPFGQYKAIHKVQHFIVAWGQIENIFSISALTPNVKPLGFTPIGMLDLG